MGAGNLSAEKVREAISAASYYHLGPPAMSVRVRNDGELVVFVDDLETDVLVAPVMREYVEWECRYPGYEEVSASLISLLESVATGLLRLATWQIRWDYMSHLEEGRGGYGYPTKTE